jgi:glycerophosphoryl diester phosphodiesterase
VPALHHDGVYGPPWRRRRVTETRSDDLPRWLPTLPALYQAYGTGFELSLDMKGPAGTHRAAVLAVLAAGRAAGGRAALSRLWLCGSLDALGTWRELDDNIHLVNSTSLRAVEGVGGIRRYAAALATAGVAVLNVRAREWTYRSAAAVRVLHETGLLAFAWNAQSPRALSLLRRFGVDGAYSDHVAWLVRAMGEQHTRDEG